MLKKPHLRVIDGRSRRQLTVGSQWGNGIGHRGRQTRKHRAIAQPRRHLGKASRAVARWNSRWHGGNCEELLLMGCAIHEIAGQSGHSSAGISRAGGCLGHSPAYSHTRALPEQQPTDRITSIGISSGMPDHAGPMDGRRGGYHALREFSEFHEFGEWVSGWACDSKLGVG